MLLESTMIIQLNKEELGYLNHAINDWVTEALAYIEKMNNYVDDYDGYDPMPAGKCANLTAYEIENAKKLTTSMNADWQHNNGNINLELYRDLFFKFSIHRDMRSNPLFLSMSKKVTEARAVLTSATQTHRLFGEAQTSSAPGLRVKIPGPEDETENSDSEDVAACSSLTI